jgi:hypothetical protein
VAMPGVQELGKEHLVSQPTRRRRQDAVDIPAISRSADPGLCSRPPARPWHGLPPRIREQVAREVWDGRYMLVRVLGSDRLGHRRISFFRIFHGDS